MLMKGKRFVLNRSLFFGAITFCVGTGNSALVLTAVL
jgi:hypothetical protein